MDTLKSERSTYSFIDWENQFKEEWLNPRKGECKIGEKIAKLTDAKYVVLGIEESIGPLANHGRAGAENAFSAFLLSFLNMQSNEFLTGDKIHILGSVKVENKPTTNLCAAVEELDDFVYSILQRFIQEGQIPIIIGGGHNNAFPLIHFSASRFQTPINVVNLDAHADYRALEGRHSGNSFSYAFHNEWMKKYFVMGLHKQYNSQYILDKLREDKHYYTFHEQYIEREREYIKDFQFLNDALQGNETSLGVELDMDVIAGMPSSASSPSGVELATARAYLRTIPLNLKIAYLHLPEGAPLNKSEDRIVGKALAYLVSDFIETMNNSNLLQVRH